MTRTIRLKITDLYSCAKKIEEKHTEYKVNLDDYSIDVFRKKHNEHVSVSSTEIRVSNFSYSFIQQLSSDKPADKIVELFTSTFNGK